MKRVLILSLLILFLFSFSFPDPYNTPNIDGSIEISPEDWDENELIDDDSGESDWGGDANDIKLIYVTWDNSNLYLGITYSLSNNGLILFIDNGEENGITDLLDYSVWSRNFQFDREINFMAAHWNEQQPSIYKTLPDGAEDISSTCQIAFQAGSVYEAAIPWSEIYREADNTVNIGAVLNISCAVVGGDGYGGGDIAPNNSDFISGAGPYEFSQYYEFQIDENNDGLPDFGGQGSLGSISGRIEFQDYANPPYPEAEIKAYNSNTGNSSGSGTSSPENGEFTIYGLEPENDYDLEIISNGYAAEYVDDVNVPDTNDVFIGNIILLPFTGKIRGFIYPETEKVFVQAYYLEGNPAGFSDSTDGVTGSYEITHLSAGEYYLKVYPQNPDYIITTSENVSVVENETTELSLTLEEAGILWIVQDTVGDDYGSGNIAYPTNEVFVPGSFDIEYVRLVDAGDDYKFDVKMVEIPGSDVVNWNPNYGNLNTLKLDIYIDAAPGGEAEAFKDRYAEFAPVDKWDAALTADGWHKEIQWTGLDENNEQVINSNTSNYINFDADHVNNIVSIYVKKTVFEEIPDVFDTPYWDIMVLSLGHDGSGIDGIRHVSDSSSEPWQFGGGITNINDPPIIDIARRIGLELNDLEKEEGVSQEEMLDVGDFTSSSNVVLEIEKNIDKEPPVIDFNKNTRLKHLSNAPNIPIIIDIKDNVEVSKAYVYYKDINDTQFQFRELGRLSITEVGSEWICDLPYEFYEENTMEFYFKALDNWIEPNIAFLPTKNDSLSEHPDNLYSFSEETPSEFRLNPVRNYDIDSETISSSSWGNEIYSRKFSDGSEIFFKTNDILNFINEDGSIKINYYIPENTESNLPENSVLNFIRHLTITDENENELINIPYQIDLHYYLDLQDDYSESELNKFSVSALVQETNTWLQKGTAHNMNANYLTVKDKYKSNLICIVSDNSLSAGNDGVSSIKLSPKSFSPNGDGLYDITDITYYIGKQEGKLTLTIFDYYGNQIIELTHELQVYKGRHDIIKWDGKNSDGEYVESGIYILNFLLEYTNEGNENFKEIFNEAVVVIR